MQMQVRKKVAELTPGDYIVRIAGRKTPVNGTYREQRDLPAGTVGYGPRGGRYRLTEAGADRVVAVVTSGPTPYVRRDATAVIEVME